MKAIAERPFSMEAATRNFSNPARGIKQLTATLPRN